VIDGSEIAASSSWNRHSVRGATSEKVSGGGGGGRSEGGRRARGRAKRGNRVAPNTHWQEYRAKAESEPPGMPPAPPLTRLNRPPPPPAPPERKPVRRIIYRQIKRLNVARTRVAETCGQLIQWERGGAPPHPPAHEPPPFSRPYAAAA